MNRKEQAVEMIKNRINKESYLTYEEIAISTGYHPKYILKLKKEILDGSIKIVHGNTNRKPVNSIDAKEKEYIISLFKRSNASIRKFCRFYGKRSYSCIYNILKEANLI